MSLDVRETLQWQSKLKNTLRDMQWKQLQHDNIYHPDIACLAPIDKVTHFTLHLNKYVPKIIRRGTDELGDQLATLIDLGIIVTSVANLFSVKLHDLTLEKLKDSATAVDIVALPEAAFQALYEPQTVIDELYLFDSLLKHQLGLVRLAGEMAEHVVAHRELREGNARVRITEVCVALWWEFLATFHVLSEATEGERSFLCMFGERLDFVESKNPHYAKRPKYIQNFSPV